MSRDRGSVSCTMMLIYGLVAGFLIALMLRILPGQQIAQQPDPREELKPGTVIAALPAQSWETKIMVIDRLIEGKVEGNLLQNLLFKDRLLLQSRGEVIAGIDMSQLKESDIQVSGTRVSITLPPTRILNSRIDNKHTFVYERETGLLSNGDPELETKARQMAEGQLIPAACEQQILQIAAVQAQENVTQLLLMVGFTDVDVKAPIGTCAP